MVKVLLVAGFHANEGFSNSVAQKVAEFLSNSGVAVIFKKIPYKESSLHHVLSSKGAIYPFELENLEDNLRDKVDALVKETGADLAYTFHTTRTESTFWNPKKRSIVKKPTYSYTKLMHNTKTRKLDFAIWPQGSSSNHFVVEIRSAYKPMPKRVSLKVKKNFKHNVGFGWEFKEKYLSDTTSHSLSSELGLFPENLARGITGVVMNHIRLKSRGLPIIPKDNPGMNELKGRAFSLKSRKLAKVKRTGFTR